MSGITKKISQMKISAISSPQNMYQNMFPKSSEVGDASPYFSQKSQGVELLKTHKFKGPPRDQESPNLILRICFKVVGKNQIYSPNDGLDILEIYYGLMHDKEKLW